MHIEARNLDLMHFFANTFKIDFIYLFNRNRIIWSIITVLLHWKRLRVFQIFSPLQLEPLGVNTELDKTKLVQSKKASERKAVKKAYEEVNSNLSDVFIVFVCQESMWWDILNALVSPGMILTIVFLGNSPPLPGYRRNCWPSSGAYNILTYLSAAFCTSTLNISFNWMNVNIFGCCFYTYVLISFNLLRSIKDRKLLRKEHLRYEWFFITTPPPPNPPSWWNCAG